jgi:predicted transcriptional regulator
MPEELKKIKKMRQKLGITQIELAKIANVSQSVITKIERGKIEPSYTIAKKIITALEEQLANSKFELKARDICVRRIISVRENDRIKDALDLMIKHSISQMPVKKDKYFVGSISEEILIKKLSKIKKQYITVKEIMDEAFPTVPDDANLALIKELLKLYNAIIVIKNGKPFGIISKTDLLKSYSF